MTFSLLFNDLQMFFLRGVLMTGKKQDADFWTLLAPCLTKTLHILVYTFLFTIKQAKT
jgi:hypothetical protein